MARLGGRIAFAVTGAIVLAVVGGVVGARSALPDGQPAIAAADTTPTATATNAIVVSVATATVSTTVVAPTSTASQVATATPRPAPTARPTITPGGVTTLSCTITSINASAGTFACRTNGVTTTVVTNGQTQFTGAATSFSALRTGMRARNTGVYQTDGTFVTTRVSASIND